MELGNYDQALLNADRFLEKENNCQGYVLRCLVYLELDEPEKALEELKIAGRSSGSMYKLYECCDRLNVDWTSL